jgi:hypothetical protein
MQSFRFLPLFVAALCLCISASGQTDPRQHLSEARSAYQGENYDAARFALQQSLHEIDMMIGQEILLLLPAGLGGLSSNAGEDDLIGSVPGLTGVNVTRKYSGSDPMKKIEINVMSNSPLLAAITTWMSNPILAGMAGDPNQKAVRVQNYKSQLVKAVNSNNQTRYELQVPLSSALFSMYFDGMDSESEVLGLANQINLAGIAKLVQGY